MQSEITDWYIAKIENTPYLGGTLEHNSLFQVFEPITRISCLTTDEYYIIETDENIYRCTISEENKPLHCDMASAYFDSAKLVGMYFVNRLEPAHFYPEELKVLTDNIYNNISPDIVQDIREMPEITKCVEDALRQFIRTTGLCYPEGAIPSNTEDLVYEQLMQLIKN